MAAAMTTFTSNDWETYTWAATDRASALNELVASFQYYQSPVVVPIFGQSDHWATVTQVTATLNAGSWTINHVNIIDGGPPNAMDSGTNGYLTGLLSFSGTIWTNVYYHVPTVINTDCDPCTSDPYYNRYVLVFDPPRGQTHPPVSAVFAKAPGVAPAGQHAMNEQLARRDVWKALTSAGIDADPAIWNAISRGVPGAAFQVNAVWPSGSPWDYYLVPILSNTNTAIAFVQLAADDGSFEGINVLKSSVRFSPVTMRKAERLARGMLAKGERLTGGVLTWDARSDTRIARSPIRPYYEFGVDSATQRDTHVGKVRVTLTDGTVERNRQAQVRAASR